MQNRALLLDLILRLLSVAFIVLAFMDASHAEKLGHVVANSGAAIVFAIHGYGK